MKRFVEVIKEFSKRSGVGIGIVLYDAFLRSNKTKGTAFCSWSVFQMGFQCTKTNGKNGVLWTWSVSTVAADAFKTKDVEPQKRSRPKMDGVLKCKKEGGDKQKE